MKRSRKVSILLSSYNGSNYLREQLDSIKAQSYTNWELYISDDGSTDNTLDILNQFKKVCPKKKVTIMEGPGKGFARNFFSMLRNKNILSDYYAFCDQDDFWLSDKLEAAILSLNELSSSSYKLYGARTFVVNSKCNRKKYSPLFKGPFSFGNALLQNYAGGNTMVFSRGLKLVFESLPEDLSIVSHDWITYIICSAIGGKIIYDKQPRLFYRQHEKNLIGSNVNFISKISRLRKIINGEFKVWIQTNYKTLVLLEEIITPENREIIDNFYRSRSPFSYLRFKLFIQSKIYRQYAFETFLFVLMSFFKRIV